MLAGPALEAVGGLAGLRTTIHEPSMFQIVAPREITLFYITVISFNALVGWVTQPHTMGMAAAALVGTLGIALTSPDQRETFRWRKILQLPRWMCPLRGRARKYRFGQSL